MGVLRELMHKHFWKAFFGLLALVLISLTIAFLTDYYGKKSALDAAASQQKIDEEMIQKYNADTYGGKTPEETLALFISALKKGDTTLASKYFILDEQAKWKKNLEKIDITKLKSWATDIQIAKRIDSNESRAVFEYKRKFDGGVVNVQSKDFNIKPGLVVQPINLGRGPNGIWKILTI